MKVWEGREGKEKCNNAKKVCSERRGKSGSRKGRWGRARGKGVGRGGAGEAVGYWQDDLHTNIALHEEGPTVCSAPASCTGYWIGHNCP